jgi:hypothetical protein
MDGTQRDKQRIEQLEAALRQSEERHASELAAPRREPEGTLQEAGGKTGADDGKGVEDGAVGSKALLGGSAGDGVGGRGELLAGAALQRAEALANAKLLLLPAAEEKIKELEAKLKEASAKDGRQSEELAKARQELAASEDRCRRLAGRRESAEATERPATAWEAGISGDEGEPDEERNEELELDLHEERNEELELDLHEERNEDFQRLLFEQIAAERRGGDGRDIAAPVGPAGLTNFGGTCYLNAALKTVVAAGGSEALDGAAPTDPPPQHPALAREAAALLRALASPANDGTVLDPSGVFANLAKSDGHGLSSMSDPWQHECPAECLVHLVDQTSNLKRTTGLAPRFAYTSETTLTCGTCGARSRSSVVDLVLQLSLPKHKRDQDRPVAAQAMLKAAVARIKLGGRDEYEVYKCDTCGPREVQDGWKQDALTKLGAMLALHIKRFEVVDPVRLDDGTLIGETRKRDDRVEFGPRLMIPTTDVDGAVSPVPSELRAVVAHVGDTMDAGHCIAFVKGADNRWYMHDDRYVRLATDDEVFGVEAQRQAYLLLYKVRLDIDIDIYTHTHTHT